MRALLRFTPAYDPHVLVDRPDLARELMVDRGGLRMLPGQEIIPLVVDHDMDRRVGVVREMFTDTDTDGRRWNFASVTLDPNPPAWLKRDTPVSWGYKAFGTREAAWGSKTKHITDAFLEEISVLRMLNPAEKLAKVLWVGEIAETPAAVRASSDRAAAGEVIPIRRAARSRPTTFPRSEFERRMDFAIDLAENLGIHGAVEAELEHMQRLERAMQLGRMPPALVLGVR